VNITILCGYTNSPYARDVLRALNAHGLRQIDVVAAAGGSVPRTWTALWAAYRWQLPWAAARWVLAGLVRQLKRRGDHGSVSANSLEAEVQTQGGRFICVPELNGDECRRTLQAWRVDLMILAGTPIIRKPLLEVPRLGTINAHQGALPHFRGMNVIEWAILEGCAPAITVHFVDAGVDTGHIIVTEPVPILPGDTLDVVRMRASAQQSDLLARTVRTASAGPLPRRPQRPEEGRQYFTMHPQLRAIAEQRLRQPQIQTIK
jgi:methionyl-tRNA formyltransferase